MHVCFLDRDVSLTNAQLNNNIRTQIFFCLGVSSMIRFVMNVALIWASTSCLTMIYHLSMHRNYIAYEHWDRGFIIVTVLNCPTIRLLRSFKFLIDKYIWDFWKLTSWWFHASLLLKLTESQKNTMNATSGSINTQFLRHISSTMAIQLESFLLENLV